MFLCRETTRGAIYPGWAASKEMAMWKLSCAIIFLVLSSFCEAAPAAPETPQIEGLKFSEPELKLLKRLNQIQAGAGIASAMLKAAPFVQIFSSPAPADVAITIGTSDWDKIFGALKGLNKIQACKTVEEIDLWKEVDGNSYATEKSKEFFTEVRSKAQKGC